MTTEEKLAKSFKQNLKEKNADRITVQEIAEGASVIRATFYNHFKDKGDLLGFIIRTEILEPVMGLLRNGLYKEGAVLMFRTMQEDRDFYLSVSPMKKPRSFGEIVNACFAGLIESYLRSRPAEENMAYPWLTVEMVSDLYGHIVTFIVMEWIRDGMKATPEELGSVFEYLGSRSLFDILELVSKGKSVTAENEGEKIARGLARYREESAK